MGNFSNIDRAIFRPHALPRLEECIRYEGNTGTPESEAAARGTRLHALCCAVLAGKLLIEDIEDPEDRACVAWAVGEIRVRRIGVEYLEYKVEIKVAGETVTEGSADGWGRSNAELWVFDFKSGDERDYSAQFMAYAKPIMEETGETRCVFLALYFDLREAREYDVELADCEPRIAELANRWLTRENEPPAANQYCGWCAVRGSCPVWLESSKQALALLPEPEPELPEWIDTIELIKADPAKLAKFYTAYKRLAKLVAEDWRIKETIQGYLESGTEVPGFSMGSRKGSAKVDAERALALVERELGAMRFAQCISVDADKLRAAWSEFMGPDRPFPLDVTYGATSYFPRATQPKGAGKARVKRGERAREVAA
jgi:Protein of unknown function (DUF2800)